MTTGFGPLATLRVTRLVQQIADLNTVAPRLWNSRAARVNAPDDEIIGKISAPVIAADIITDDAQAGIHTSGSLTLSSGKVPNYKHGHMLSQARLREIRAIERNAQGITGETEMVNDYIGTRLRLLLEGIRDRIELIICAMLTDTVTYDRFGIKFTGMNWGMPASLKYTPGVLWSTAATATPIADILLVNQNAINLGGTGFNRVTMPTAAFLLAIATTEFINHVKFGLNDQQLTYLNLNLVTQDQKRRILGQILGMEIELYDAQTTTEDPSGAHTSVRFLPTNKVILSNTVGDNNAAVWDFAAGEIIESLVADMTGIDSDLGNLGTLFGPVSYATPANINLNPPGVVLWAVDRGAPRKHDDNAFACLTVS